MDKLLGSFNQNFEKEKTKTMMRDSRFEENLLSLALVGDRHAFLERPTSSDRNLALARIVHVKGKVDFLAEANFWFAFCQIG